MSVIDHTPFFPEYDPSRDDDDDCTAADWWKGEPPKNPRPVGGGISLEVIDAGMRRLQMIRTHLQDQERAALSDRITAATGRTVSPDSDFGGHGMFCPKCNKLFITSRSITAYVRHLAKCDPAEAKKLIQRAPHLQNRVQQGGAR